MPASRAGLLMLAGKAGRRDQVSPSWVGEIFVAQGKNKNPEYHGFGQVTFSQPADPLAEIRAGKGFYWNVDETHPQKTNYKVIQLKRITDPAVVRTMKDGKRHEKAALTAFALEKWDSV